MTAEQAMRDLEREADRINARIRNVDNIFGLIQAATEFKRPGGYYTDPRIPVGHVHITHYPVPYSDKTELYEGRVLHEGNLFIRIDLGSGESATFHKRDCIITRGTGK